MQGRNRDTDRENTLDPVEAGEGGASGETGTETSASPRVKQSQWGVAA